MNSAPPIYAVRVEMHEYMDKNHSMGLKDTNLKLYLLLPGRVEVVVAVGVDGLVSHQLGLGRLHGSAVVSVVL